VINAIDEVAIGLNITGVGASRRRETLRSETAPDAGPQEGSIWHMGVTSLSRGTGSALRTTSTAARCPARGARRDRSGLPCHGDVARAMDGSASFLR